jgi:hypothetical protein
MDLLEAFPLLEMLTWSRDWDYVCPGKNYRQQSVFFQEWVIYSMSLLSVVIIKDVACLFLPKHL